jgi:RES domain
MELTPQAVAEPLRDTHRLIPSRFPPVGILDLIASPADLPYVMELEGWTNDRLLLEYGVIHSIPQDEWAVGVPGASVIMAAFGHPRPGGSRFNDGERGAWYAALDVETAHSENAFHRYRQLYEEIGLAEGRAELREYLADFDCEFHDVRPSPAFDALHDPDSYATSQKLARELLHSRSNGIRYRSVRHPRGECIACFRPKLVLNLRQGTHFEYVWTGNAKPEIRKLP